MEGKNLREYAALMAEFGLTEIEIEEKDSKVRLERKAAVAQGAVLVPEASSSGEETALLSPPSDTVEIRSPMVGVFYCSPAEDAEPYVKVGDHIQKGDNLCIIEAMKLMNEISADQEGVIVEVCAGNGQVVDYGHVLFRLRKDS